MELGMIAGILVAGLLVFALLWFLVRP
jgi:hypothetical protein